MLGTHQSSAVLQRENSIVQPIRQILKDFMDNEEGFLSTKYVNILKKYYTEEFAEKLFVLHGVLISSSAALGTNEDLSRRRGFISSLRKDISCDSRFYSIATSSECVSASYETALDDAREQLGESADQLAMDRHAFDYLQVSAHDQIRWGARMYLDDGQLRSNSISREFMYLLAAKHARVDPGTVEHTAFTDLLQGVDYKGAGKIVKALVGNDLGLIFFPRHSSGGEHWLKPCVYNVDHISSIRRSGTASTLQAFFHMDNVSGYDGSTTLSKLKDGTF